MMDYLTSVSARSTQTMPGVRPAPISRFQDVRPDQAMDSMPAARRDGIDVVDTEEFTQERTQPVSFRHSFGQMDNERVHVESSAAGSQQQSSMKNEHALVDATDQGNSERISVPNVFLPLSEPIAPGYHPLMSASQQRRNYEVSEEALTHEPRSKNQVSAPSARLTKTSAENSSPSVHEAASTVSKPRLNAVRNNIDGRVVRDEVIQRTTGVTDLRHGKPATTTRTSSPLLTSKHTAESIQTVPVSAREAPLATNRQLATTLKKTPEIIPQSGVIAILQARSQHVASQAMATPAPPETIVHVTIGRVEVRANIAPQNPPSKRDSSRTSSQPLEDYLRGRSAGRSS